MPAVKPKFRLFGVRVQEVEMLYKENPRIPARVYGVCELADKPGSVLFLGKVTIIRLGLKSL